MRTDDKQEVIQTTVGKQKFCGYKYCQLKAVLGGKHRDYTCSTECSGSKKMGRQWLMVIFLA